MVKKNRRTHLAAAEQSEERFDTSKPQFKHGREKDAKVVLTDDRFSSLLTDPRFSLDFKDKYGRKKKGKNSTKEELSAFYTVEEAGADAKQSPTTTKELDNKDDNSRQEESDDDGHETETKTERDDVIAENEDPASRIAFLTRLSRGELNVSSSDEDDSENEEGEADVESESEADKEGEDPLYGEAGILDPEKQEEIAITHEESSVLAVMNLDWSQIRAIDVLALVGSFTPPGAVKRVRVFPSDFGMKRIATEEQFGPRDLWKKKKVNVDEDDDAKAEDESDSDNESNSDEVPKEGDGPQKKEIVHSDFDPEKLRKYEASKLKYFFAVVEFTSAQHADKAYKEVDGMEFEHSSAAVDMRAMSENDLPDVVEGRPVRDEATSLPSNYQPPEFVVSALQQTNVQCSWEMGDKERERVLTKYSSGMAWEAMAESDDIKAYLASDASSDEEEDEEERNALRKKLGLESEDEDTGKEGLESKQVESISESDSESDEDGSDGDVDQSKEIVLTTGKSELEDKIRSKLKNPEKEDMTPWEKYKEKRKQRQKERRQAAKQKQKEIKESRQAAKKPTKGQTEDSFFASSDNEDDERPTELSKEELELLVAGDGNVEEDNDFDMRALQRVEKNKDKKLKGSRKRKEDTRSLNAVGKDFQVDIEDNRFTAVLDGQDERFGIDRTDPHFKETPAMREILAEQNRRRTVKRRKKSGERESEVRKDVSAEDATTAAKPSGGAAALSALVKSLKSKVQQ